MIKTTDEELLAEMEHSQLELFGLIKQKEFENQMEDPDKMRMLVIDTIRRLLENKDIIAILERIGEGTEIWDFESEKVIEILEKNWELLKHDAGEKGDREFSLFKRKYIPNMSINHSMPIIFLKEPPEIL